MSNDDNIQDFDAEELNLEQPDTTADDDAAEAGHSADRKSVV